MKSRQKLYDLPGSFLTDLLKLTCMDAGENKAIVVGNAQPELVEWLMQQPQDDRLIYTGAHLARGVLEGIARHGLY